MKWEARVGANLQVQQFRHASRVWLKTVRLVAFGSTRNEAISNLRDLIETELDIARSTHNAGREQKVLGVHMRRPRRSVIKHVDLG